LLCRPHVPNRKPCTPLFHLPSRAVRGRVITNSVNSFRLESTVIVPPCCFATMSKLSDSPRPVPSPAGFVVKNGSKILSRTSGRIPVPLSRMRISRPSSRAFVVAVTVGSKPGSAPSPRSPRRYPEEVLRRGRCQRSR